MLPTSERTSAGISRRTLLTGSAALAVSSGALGELAQPARAQAATTIRIGIIPVDSAAAVVFARDSGIFEKLGIDAQLEAIQSGSAIAAAVNSGSLDIGWAAVDVVALLHSRGIPVKLIAPGGIYSGGPTDRTAGVLVKTDSPIRTAKDLNGKIIATNALHSFGETNVRAWVDENGGDSTTLKFIEIPLPLLAPAVDSGRIDAASILEPFLTAPAKTHRVIYYGYSAIAPLFLSSAYFTSPAWAHDNPDVLKRFVTGVHDAGIWAGQNQAKSNEMLAKFTKLAPEVVATMGRSRYGENLTAALLQPVVDISAKYNGYKPYPAQELIYAPPR